MSCHRLAESALTRLRRREAGRARHAPARSGRADDDDAAAPQGLHARDHLLRAAQQAERTHAERLLERRRIDLLDVAPGGHVGVVEQRPYRPHLAGDRVEDALDRVGIGDVAGEGARIRQARGERVARGTAPREKGHCPALGRKPARQRRTVAGADADDHAHLLPVHVCFSSMAGERRRFPAHDVDPPGPGDGRPAASSSTRRGAIRPPGIRCRRRAAPREAARAGC